MISPPVNIKSGGNSQQTDRGRERNGIARSGSTTHRPTSSTRPDWSSRCARTSASSSSGSNNWRTRSGLA